MSYHFSDFVLDVKRQELRRGESLVAVEPQVFDLLHHLIRNAERLVSKDELLEVVWGGRFVSESALTTRLNAARRAVGDSGEKQHFIKTIARRGYRFIAEVRDTLADPYPLLVPATPVPSAEEHPGSGGIEGPRADASVAAAGRRRSIAVMPFTNLSEAAYTRGGLGDALAQDIITRLAKLRVMFVIAEQSSVALRERGVTVSEAGRLLDVDYTVGGTLSREAGKLRVQVELTEVATNRIVWTDIFVGTSHDIFAIIEDIGGRVVSGAASEIEALERNRAILRPANSLDAWEAYHRGLWHMYRFDKPNNEQARLLFEQSTRLDPAFSRAYAGLSFTHWQSAFQGWADRQSETELAYAAAGQGLMADDRDPAAHWAMGRALWLQDSPDHALAELQHAVDLSPNFASGHYAISFVQSQTGDAVAAIDAADHAIALSPYDPMLFAMLATRALALVRLGRYDEAADWGERAAARPNAHSHVLAIAYHCFLVAGRDGQAQRILDSLKRRVPGYRFEDFARAFHLPSKTEALLRQHATGTNRLC